jgi:hypothetical protein
MRDRIRIYQMMDAEDGKYAVMGDSLGTRKQDNVALPEGLWLLADRHLAIGQKRNTNSVYSVPLVRETNGW